MEGNSLWKLAGPIVIRSRVSDYTFDMMYKTQFVRVLAVAMGLVAMAIISACTTTENGSAAEAPFVVVKGMETDVLVDGLGDPDEVIPYSEELENFELWIYKKEITTSKMVSTEMKEIPFVDPVTGHEGTELQNVISPEITVTKKRTIFLVAEGKVVAWKVEQKDNSSI